MPKFSVIIASVNGLPSIGECLAALEKSRRDFDVEIIVVDSTDAATAANIEKNFPLVKLIKLPERLGIPEMRAIGMHEASGDFFIVIEDHCMVTENWFEEIKKAHDSGYEVVGGAVENGCTSRLIDWSVFLCEYSGFMPPIPVGEVEFLAGNNVSYGRSQIEQIDDSIKNDFWEYFLQLELRKKNIKFCSFPSIVVFHKKEFGFFYFLSQRFYYSRSFAAMRRKKSTLLQMVFYLAYTPILPFHLMWRIVKNVVEKKRNRKELVLSLPFLAIFMCSYAVGEFTGLLFGSGNSLLKVE
ncbi:MAG: glycosyltransferase family 2 protein [Pyrinomonadaceae bacterium]